MLRRFQIRNKLSNSRTWFICQFIHNGKFLAQHRFVLLLPERFRIRHGCLPGIVGLQRMHNFQVTWALRCGQAFLGSFAWRQMDDGFLSKHKLNCKIIVYPASFYNFYFFTVHGYCVNSVKFEFSLFVSFNCHWVNFHDSQIIVHAPIFLWLVENPSPI